MLGGPTALGLSRAAGRTIGLFGCARPNGAHDRAMSDHATPNLPSRDFSATELFYGALGFVQGWRDEGWMILTRTGVTLEFFPFPDLDLKASSFSCCLRLDDLDAFYAVANGAGIIEASCGHPRLHPPTLEDSGMRIAYLVDPDGSLMRLVQN